MNFRIFLYSLILITHPVFTAETFDRAQGLLSQFAYAPTQSEQQAVRTLFLQTAHDLRRLNVWERAYLCRQAVVLDIRQQKHKRPAFFVIDDMSDADKSLLVGLYTDLRWMRNKLSYAHTKKDGSVKTHDVIRYDIATQYLYNLIK